MTQQSSSLASKDTFNKYSFNLDSCAKWIQKKERILLSCALLVMIPFFSFGQNHIDLFNANYNISPQNAYEGNNGSVNIHEYTADIQMPFVRKNKDVIFTALRVKQVHLEQINNSFNDLRVYTGMLRVGYQKQWSDKVNTLLMAIPKINSDFRNVGDKLFQIGAIGLVGFKRSETFTYKLGMYYNREFFGNFFVPIVGINWQINDRWQFYGNLPIYATLSRKLNDKFNAGASFRAFIVSYRLGEYNDSYLEKSIKELYAFVEYNLPSNIVLQGRIGTTIGRYFRTYNENDKVDWKLSAVAFGDNRKATSPDFADGLVAQISLIYRYPIKKEDAPAE